MTTYKPINLSTDEYLKQLEDVQKRERIKRWLEAMSHMFSYIGEVDNVSVSFLPEIRVPDTDETGAEGNIYAVCISKGTIDHCYNLSSDALKCIDDPNIDEINSIPDIVQTSTFLWMMAHEFYHGARGHNDRIDAEFSKGIHTMSALKKGIEYDADLYAVEHLHRSIKNWLVAALPNAQINVLSRQIVLCVLFSSLHMFPSTEIGETHPSRAQRLLSILCKLAMIRANPEDPIDEDLILPQTRELFSFLLDLTIKCGRQFLTKHGALHGNLLNELAEEMENPNTDHIAAWDAMKLKPFRSA